MDERLAQSVADAWSGGAGLVARGPKVVLAARPATPADVQRHTGRRPSASRVWRIEVGGRFLRSGGLVYPGGVPYPEELHSQTAVVAGEVWLYADDDGRVLGAYWWPEALRRPIASVPRDEYDAGAVVRPDELSERVAGCPALPDLAPWQPVLAACRSASDALVFYSDGQLPDPVHEMLLLENGGLTLSVAVDQPRPDADAFTRSHAPPYRRLREPGPCALGRDPGRSLGPQTWPWPAELRWWESGVSYELRGFRPLNELVELTASAARRAR